MLQSVDSCFHSLSNQIALLDQTLINSLPPQINISETRNKNKIIDVTHSQKVLINGQLTESVSPGFCFIRMFIMIDLFVCS